jgi:hypothetical protein
MASSRQIEANRRNARNSTGPRSTSGKKRASQNAFRHGLTKRIASAEFDREVETLARQIAGDIENKTTIELARSAAEGELELARVRRVRADLIERVAAFGRFDPPKFYQTPRVRGSLLQTRARVRYSTILGCETCRRSGASDALAGATAVGRGGAPNSPGTRQATPLRIPRC